MANGSWSNTAGGMKALEDAGGSAATAPTPQSPAGSPPPQPPAGSRARRRSSALMGAVSAFVTGTRAKALEAPRGGPTAL